MEVSKVDIVIRYLALYALPFRQPLSTQIL
jgi:hypothetical protein